MNSGLSIVFSIVGACVALLFGGGPSLLFHALVGALLGFAIAELSGLRTRLLALEAAQEQLRRNAQASPRTQASEPASSIPRQFSEEGLEPPQATPPAPRDVAQDVDPFAHWARARRMESPETARSPRPAPPPAPPPEPAPMLPPMPPPQLPPTAVEELWHRFAGGGNLLVRIGILVLFFGTAFLIRYVAEHSRIPIGARLSAIALAAFVLLGLGWRLRKRRPGYAFALQGGALGILYLTVFAAQHLYALLPVAMAFSLLVGIVVATSAFAVVQDTQSLAVIAVIGGFLAPVLEPAVPGDHVMLFSYYLALNAGIALIAWFKTWRGLILAGFIFTFGIGTAWGVLTYQPAAFMTTEPFLIAFFLLYVAVAVLFTSRQPIQWGGYVDATLVFGTPLAAFVLQASMLTDRRHLLAGSALVLSLLYLALAGCLKRLRQPLYRPLADAFMAIGVVFFTLAIPLRLGSHWVAGAWALEGSALVWFGCRQGRVASRLFGVLLILAAGAVTLQDLQIIDFHLRLPLEAYLPVLLVSAAALIGATQFQSLAGRDGPFEALASESLLVVAVVWWVMGGLGVLPQLLSATDIPAASLAFLALTAAALGLAYSRLPLDTALAGALALLPVMLLFAFREAGVLDHPLQHGGWIAWPCAFGSFYFTMRRIEANANRNFVAALHVLAAWLAIGLMSWEISWLVDQLIHGSNAWPLVLQALPAVTALMAFSQPANGLTWPIGRHRGAYVLGVGGGCLVYLSLWQLYVDASLNGDVAPLPYLPLINPIDVGQLVVLIVALRYAKRLQATYPDAASDLSPIMGILGFALPFLWVNALLLRTLHQWLGIPFSIVGVLASTLAQTALTITWTLIAICLMLAAQRRHARTPWFAGAGLLGLVIVKLFIVDLSNVGSIARIVSFVGVGLMMLLVGYFSPLPPRSRAIR